MIIDKLLSFDTNATITGGTTVASVDYADLGVSVPGRKLGSGQPLWLVIAIKSNTGGDGADTLAFSLVTDDNTSFSSATTVATSPTVTGVANLPSGSRVVIPVPPGVAFERYIRVAYAVTATAVLVVDAFLTDQEIPDLTAYQDGTTDWDA